MLLCSAIEVVIAIKMADYVDSNLASEANLFYLNGRAMSVYYGIFITAQVFQFVLLFDAVFIVNRGFKVKYCPTGGMSYVQLLDVCILDHSVHAGRSTIEQDTSYFYAGSYSDLRVVSILSH